MEKCDCPSRTHRCFSLPDHIGRGTFTRTLADPCERAARGVGPLRSVGHRVEQRQITQLVAVEVRVCRLYALGQRERSFAVGTPVGSWPRHAGSIAVCHYVMSGGHPCTGSAPGCTVRAARPAGCRGSGMRIHRTGCSFTASRAGADRSWSPTRCAPAERTRSRRGRAPHRDPPPGVRAGAGVPRQRRTVAARALNSPGLACRFGRGRPSWC